MREQEVQLFVLSLFFIFLIFSSIFSFLFLQRRIQQLEEELRLARAYQDRELPVQEDESTAKTPVTTPVATPKRSRSGDSRSEPAKGSPVSHSPSLSSLAPARKKVVVVDDVIRLPACPLCPTVEFVTQSLEYDFREYHCGGTFDQKQFGCNSRLQLAALSDLEAWLFTTDLQAEPSRALWKILSTKVVPLTAQEQKQQDPTRFVVRLWACKQHNACEARI